MSEKTKKPVEETKVEETTAAEPVKKPVAKAKTEEETTVKKKDDGLFTRTKNWFKRHKEVLIAGGVGVAAGVGGTIGVGEVAKRRAEKRGRQQNAAYVPHEDYSPLDPNV